MVEEEKEINIKRVKGLGSREVREKGVKVEEWCGCEWVEREREKSGRG